MKTSPFAPWADATPDAPADTSAASASLLQQAAEQLSEAASRLSSLDAPGAAPATVAIQVTVATPWGEPLPFTADPGPDLTLS